MGGAVCPKAWQSHRPARLQKPWGHRRNRKSRVHRGSHSGQECIVGLFCIRRSNHRQLQIKYSWQTENWFVTPWRSYQGQWRFMRHALYWTSLQNSAVSQQHYESFGLFCGIWRSRERNTENTTMNTEQKDVMLWHAYDEKKRKQQSYGYIYIRLIR